MIPGEERPCCDNCMYMRNDWEPFNCAYQIDYALNDMYTKGKDPTADEILELIDKTTVERGDYCPNWRWEGDE